MLKHVKAGVKTCKGSATFPLFENQQEGSLRFPGWWHKACDAWVGNQNGHNEMWLPLVPLSLRPTGVMQKQIQVAAVHRVSMCHTWVTSNFYKGFASKYVPPRGALCREKPAHAHSHVMCKNAHPVDNDIVRGLQTSPHFTPNTLT